MVHLTQKLKQLVKRTSVKMDIAKMEREQKEFWTIQRKIFPSSIEEKKDHLIIDGTIYARCRIVGVPSTGVGYPRDMEPDFIDDLLGLTTKGYTIAYSFAMLPVKNKTASELVQKARYYNRENAIEYQKKNDGQTSAEYQFIDEDFMQVARNVHTGKEKMYQTAFIVVYWAESELKLREVESHMNSIFTYHRIDSEIPRGNIKEVFFAAMPAPFSTPKAFVDCFSNLCAALAATRNPNNRTDETGLLFGENFKNNSEIIIDLKALAAQHAVITGASGSGKTMAVLTWLMRAGSILRKKWVFITAKDDIITDYRNVAKTLGDSARIIDLGPKGAFNINPLQILFNPDNPTVDDFKEQFEILLEFMKLLFEDSESFNMKSYFVESLFEEYRSRGIYRDDPKTWINAKWPTLHDLRERWKRDSEDNVSAKGLVDRSALMDISWDYLSRDTKIDLNVDYLVVDISGIKGSLKPAMNFLVTALLGKLYNAHAERETIICIDEGSFFLRNPKLLQFLTDLFKLGRSYKLACWFVNQEASGLLIKGVADILKMNSYIDVIFGHNLDDDNMEVVTQYYHLTPEEKGLLKRCTPGQGLIKVGDSKTPIYVRLTDWEYNCIKGKKLEKISADVGITLKNPALSELGNEIFFEEWIEGSSAPLTKTYIPKRVGDAFGAGMMRVWIRKDLLSVGDMIGNESLLHYARVGKIAGYLTMNGIKNTINHHDDVDIVAEFKFGKVAFELELPRSHSIPELLKKKEFANSNYDRMYFIGTSENIDDLATVAGNNAIPCGSTLKELLDQLIKENKN